MLYMLLATGMRFGTAGLGTIGEIGVVPHLPHAVLSRPVCRRSPCVIRCFGRLAVNFVAQQLDGSGGSSTTAAWTATSSVLALLQVSISKGWNHSVQSLIARLYSSATFLLGFDVRLFSGGRTCGGLAL